MNTRQALLRSVESEPDVLATTIATQRQQLSDQIVIAQKAFDQEDLEAWATAARHAANVKKSLEENLEMQNSMCRKDELQRTFLASSLIEAAELSFEREGDKTFAPALKKAYAKLIKEEAKTKPKKAGGARGSR